MVSACSAIVAVGGLLAAGATVGVARARPLGVLAPSSLLPTVDLSVNAATVWNCPGPIPVTGGSSGVVTLANPSSHGASASVTIAETVVGGGAPERSLAARVLVVPLAPGSERAVPVGSFVTSKALRRAARSEPIKSTSKNGARSSRRGRAKPPVPVARVEAAVSVTVNGPQVAVSERLQDASGVAATPCAPGTATRGYTASGVTAGSSDVEVSLFNPQAAPAVVNLSVGTPSGIVQPAAYQGIPVAPRSLYVVDLGRYVPLRTRVAVAASATIGRIVVGSLTSIDAGLTTTLVGPGHSYTETGQVLAVGVGCTRARWVMPLGPVGTSETEAVRIFNPGSRAADVTLTTREAGASEATLSVVVGPGDTETVDAPTGATPATGGLVEVTSAHGVGVVVEHETYLTTKLGQVLVLSSSAPLGAATTWLLSGDSLSKHLAAELEITNPGAKATVVELWRLANATGTAAPAPLRLRTLTVGPGEAVIVPLRTTGLSSFALEVRGAGPVLVTGAQQASDSALLATAESGVPASP